MSPTPYPVHFAVERPARFTRVQLLLRLVALIVLGMFGVTFGTLFLLGYVALPVYAASRIASLESAREYTRRDGALLMKGLHWFAAVSSWLGLVAERLPAAEPEETVWLTLEHATTRPNPVEAILRIFSGLGSALVLALLCWLGVFAWLWAAVTIVVREQMGQGVFSYLLGLQRWSVRLLAYQACLVDEYPPFSFTDAPSGSSDRVAV
jgi:hypothetical protein